MPKDQKTPTNTARKRKGSKSLVLIIVGVLILGLIVLMFSNKKASVSTCTKTYKNSENQIKQGKYKEALSNLKSNSQACTKLGKQASSKKSEEKIISMRYSSALATAAYGAGDKKIAIESAKDTLEINKSMSSTQRSEMKDQSEIVFQMLTYLSQLDPPKDNQTND